MTTSASPRLSDAYDALDPETARTAVGALSVALGAVAVVAPGRTAAAFGLRQRTGPVPLLVRMVGVRNALAGVRTLQADESDRAGALSAGLVLGAVDAAAVVLAARRGALSRKAAVRLLLLLGVIALLGAAAGREQ